MPDRNSAEDSGLYNAKRRFAARSLRWVTFFDGKLDDGIQVPAELERKMDDAIARYPERTPSKRSDAAVASVAGTLRFHQRRSHRVDRGKTAACNRSTFSSWSHFIQCFASSPAGKTHIRVCRTLSCAMAGGFEVMENFVRKIGIQRSS